MSVIDLSQTICDGLVTHRGLPPVKISPYLTREDSRVHYAPGTEFQIDRLDLLGCTGTYLDAPYHRYEQGRDLAGLPLESLVNQPGLVIRARQASRAIGSRLFQGRDLAGRAVLVDTGWSVHFGASKYFDGPPFLTREAAEILVESQAALVGLDSMNIDDTADPTRPVHSLLLAAGIPIIENMAHLDRLPDNNFRFFAAPLKIRGVGSGPIRAWALVE
jgi:kynurenine formamidase